MNAAPAQPGSCRYCHCTEDSACRLANGEPCAWFSAGRTVCTNPACIRAYFAERKRAERAAWANRPRKRTPAEVHAIILAERRAKRRAKRQATRRGRGGNGRAA